jgi:hypothetical protein
VSYLLALLLLFGSTPGKAPAVAGVAGHYVLEGVHEVGSELVLKPGGQFEYMFSYGAADYAARGKWHVSGDAVILDSKPADGPPFKLVHSADLRSPDVRIWAKTKAGRPVPGLAVVLTTAQGDLTATTDRDGMAIFPQVSEPKSVVVKLEVYEKDSGVIPLNPAHDDFTFEVNTDAIITVPFHNETLKMKGDTLELLYWDKTKPIVYRRQR